jgi:hypothetical protein
MRLETKTPFIQQSLRLNFLTDCPVESRIEGRLRSVLRLDFHPVKIKATAPDGSRLKAIGWIPVHGNDAAMIGLGIWDIIPRLAGIETFLNNVDEANNSVVRPR